MTPLALALLHVVDGPATGLLAGLRHPLSGADHVLAMVAVGLWAAQLGRPYVWVLPIAFPMMMALGGVLGMVGVPLPSVEIGIALSALLLGAFVLFEVRPPIAVAAALVAAFALFHGHAHGEELPASASGLLYSIGFVLATGVLHGVGIALGTVHRSKRGQVVLRGAGAAVACGGVIFLWRAIA